MIELQKPPQVENKELSDYLLKVWVILSALQVPVKTDSTRGSAGQAGKVIFNTSDGNLNIDDGTQWILPDGSAT